MPVAPVDPAAELPEAELPDELVPDPVAPGPAVPADPAAPAPGVPDTFELVRTWLVAESQHWSPVAPVPDPEVPVPVPVCAAARPMLMARNAAVEIAFALIMVRSLHFLSRRDRRNHHNVHRLPAVHCS